MSQVNELAEFSAVLIKTAADWLSVLKSIGWEGMMCVNTETLGGANVLDGSIHGDLFRLGRAHDEQLLFLGLPIEWYAVVCHHKAGGEFPVPQLSSEAGLSIFV